MLHKFCGRLWYTAGLVMLPVTFIAMLFVLGKDEDASGKALGDYLLYSDDPFGWEYYSNGNCS